MRDRFLAEAPDQWEKYVEFAKNQQGGYRLDAVDLLDSERVVMKAAREIKQCGTRQLRLELSLDSQNPGDSVEGMNSGYVFKLTRPSADAP